MTEVSVICPVYNAERFLRRSVDSVLAQTLPKFELILIDDGSTDGSGRICDEYASRDSRVKVLHKPNGGVSSARQAGMDLASGEYFIHIDSDDWADREWLERMYKVAKAEDADVVCCDFYQVFKDRKELSRQCHPEYSQKMIAEAVAGGRMAHSLCIKLIRRSVFDAYGLCFPVEMTVAEDAFVCHSCSSEVSSVRFAKACITITTASAVRHHLPVRNTVRVWNQFVYVLICWEELLEMNGFGTFLWRQ